MPEIAEGPVFNSENTPQFGLLEPIKFGNNEILRFKPEDKDIRIDPSTREKVKPLFYAQGINGDGKLPWMLEKLAKEQQREIIAIKYTGKLEGSTNKRTLETLGPDEHESVITEMDSIQADEIVAALEMLGVDQVDTVAESRGAIRLVAAMQKNPDLFRHTFLAHPAGFDNRNYFQAHLDALHGAFNHAARKVMGKVENHTSDVASPSERRWLRDPKGWRKTQKSVAYADVRGAMAWFASAYPDKQIFIAGDKNDKSFKAERLAKNADNHENIHFVPTDWQGHGIGFNPHAVTEISNCLTDAEIPKAA